MDLINQLIKQQLTQMGSFEAKTETDPDGHTVIRIVNPGNKQVIGSISVPNSFKDLEDPTANVKALVAEALHVAMREPAMKIKNV